MVFLFLKIFFAGLFIILLFFVLKKTTTFILTFLNNHSRSIELNQFVDHNIYTKYDMTSALKPFVSPFGQILSPFSKNKKVKRPLFAERYLTGIVDEFINNTVKCRYLLILADSGMGKTCFLLNYYFHFKQHKKKKLTKIVLVPLRLKNSDDLICSVQDPNNHILLLDGLDEDAQATRDPHKRMRTLIDMTRTFKRVIITCTPHFIPHLKHLPQSIKYEIIEPNDINDPTIYRLNRVYISRLTKTDLKNHLNHLFPFWNTGNKIKITRLIQDNPTIEINPLILSFLGRIFIDRLSIKSSIDIYDAFVRISEKGIKSDIEKLKVHQILGALAKEQFLNGLNHGEHFLDRKTVAKLTATAGIDPHFFDNQTSHLITETGNGNLLFIHTSIMEFLFIQQLFNADSSCYLLPLTEKMKYFVFDRFNKGLKNNLKTEFLWLRTFELKLQGIKNNKIAQKPIALLEMVIKTNKQFSFLKKLNTAFQNPIFFEFGWDPALAQNLKQAVVNQKPSLMKFKNKDWVVNIEPQKIEISKAGEIKEEVLFSKKDFQDYDSLREQDSLVKLFSAVDLKGLKMIRNINCSDSIALLPDFKTHLKFTLCFYSNIF